ncbi:MULTISPECIES: hypothetical protein [unclassified Duganella]|uniref:hypothetical protein n=1 Tax=unclassified Duganella TaxID=2636909 RepID=UPI001113B509|nr:MULTISPECIES: hypothetical protein [unclassified Duganella]
MKNEGWCFDDNWHSFEVNLENGESAAEGYAEPRMKGVYRVSQNGQKLPVDFRLAQLWNAMEIMSVSSEKNFEVRTEVWEARNSLWVYSPSIWDAKNGNCIFSFEDENWSADASAWKDDTTVGLCLRKFPGNHRPESFSVEIDCLTLQAKISASGRALPLEHLESALDKALKFDR